MPPTDVDMAHSLPISGPILRAISSNRFLGRPLPCNFNNELFFSIKRVTISKSARQVKAPNEDGDFGFILERFFEIENNNVPFGIFGGTSCLIQKVPDLMMDELSPSVTSPSPGQRWRKE